MLEEFLAHIREGGLAKSNRFKVSITFPNQSRNPISRDFFRIYDINTRDAFRLNLFCESAELPGKSMNTTPIKRHGPPVKVPYNQLYEDVAMTFYVGEDMKEKKFFDAWQSMIADPFTGDLNYMDEYSSIVTITKLSERDEETYSVQLKKAWPIVVSPISVSMAEENSIIRLPVVFSYRKWEYVPTTETGVQEANLRELTLNAGPISNKLNSELARLRSNGISRLTNRFNKVKGIDNFFNLF